MLKFNYALAVSKYYTIIFGYNIIDEIYFQIFKGNNCNNNNNNDNNFYGSF